MGTTYLLLKNRAAFPHISPMLGSRFGGNGDLLTFARHCQTDGPDGRRVPRVLDSAHAPVITSAIRMPDAIDGGGGADVAERGFYLEDAGQPEFVSWMLQLLDAPRSVFHDLPKLLKLGGNFLTHKDTDIGAEITEVLGDCAESASFLPLLGMGRDVPEGIMSLKDGGLASTGGRTAPRSDTSSACGRSPRTSATSSAGRSSTTRSGCCRASSPCTPWAARRWGATNARASSTPGAASSTTRACTSPTAR